LHLDATGLTGERGSMQVPLLLSGTVNTSINGPLPWSFQNASLYWRVIFQTIDVNGNTLGTAGTSGTSTTTADDHTPSTVPTTVVMNLRFVYGQDFYVVGNLRVLANAWTEPPDLSPDDPSFLLTRGAEADGDLLHTARWGGISNVYDAAGHSVAGWTLTADSGTDYRVAITSTVPEPQAWALWLAGMAAVGRRMRRRIP
jgi:hypothetical protein